MYGNMQMEGMKKMDTTPMFNPNDYIVYVNGDIYEIGRIVSTHEDGAFVCYHEGETAAKTPYECMHRLTNGYVITSLGGNRFADIQIKCPNCGKVLGYA